FISDSFGKKCSFRNSIIIMTSNIGTKSFFDRKVLGFDRNEHSVIDYEDFKQSSVKELKNYLKPELINRIDNIVVFKPLDKAKLFKIIDKYIDEINELLAKSGKKIAVDEAIKDFLLKNEYDYNFGARPLRRLITRYIEEPLSDLLISGKFQRRKNIYVYLKDGKIAFK
ncbi:MAG: AAA family ATPase, partial [Deferribacterales bacterium]